jgi:hypothetical protein
MLHSSIIIFNNRRTHLLLFFRSPPMCLCYFFLLSSVKCTEQHKYFTITRFSYSMSQFFSNDFDVHFYFENINSSDSSSQLMRDSLVNFIREKKKDRDFHIIIKDSNSRYVV